MTYQRIATATVGATASTIVFSAIPATFTDLMVVCSLRNASGGNESWSLAIDFNGSPSRSRRTLLSGAGATPTVETTTDNTVGYVARTSTSEIFSNTTIRILDYTSTIAKMLFVENGNNYFANGQSSFTGQRIDNTVAISSITLSDSNNTTFIQNSTATLYGILKGGSGATISTT